MRAAYDALESGDSSPIVLNAADEKAVDLFLAGQTEFAQIPRIVLDALQSIPPQSVETLEDVVAFHEEVMERVKTRRNGG